MQRKTIEVEVLGMYGMEATYKSGSYLIAHHRSEWLGQIRNII